MACQEKRPQSFRSPAQSMLSPGDVMKQDKHTSHGNKQDLPVTPATSS